MKEATKINRIYLGKKLAKSYIQQCIKEGKTDKEIKKGFTLDKLNELVEDFCKKYNFECID